MQDAFVRKFIRRMGASQDGWDLVTRFEQDGGYLSFYTKYGRFFQKVSVVKFNEIVCAPSQTIVCTERHCIEMSEPDEDLCQTHLDQQDCRHTQAHPGREREYEDCGAELQESEY